MSYTKKYYAVKIGFKAGIYDRWSDCKEQVETYESETGQRPVFKSFLSRDEAEKFLKDPTAGYQKQDYGPKKIDEAFVVVGSRNAGSNINICLLDRKPECFDGFDESILSLPFSNYAIEIDQIQELKNLTDDESKKISKPANRYSASLTETDSVYLACLRAASDAKTIHKAKTITFCHDPDSIRAWRSLINKSLEDAERAHYRNVKTGKLRSDAEYLKSFADRSAKTLIDDRASRHMDIIKLKRKNEDAEIVESLQLPEFLSLKSRGTFKIEPKNLPTDMAKKCLNPSYFESDEFKQWLESETKRFYEWLGILDEETRRTLYEELEQKTEDWKACRQYVMTATSAQDATGSSPYNTREGFLLAKLYSHLKARNSQSELARMEVGNINEDEARNSCLSVVAAMYEYDVASTVKRFYDVFDDRTKKRRRLERSEVKEMTCTSETFLGGIFFSEKEEFVGMACSDDGDNKFKEETIRGTNSCIIEERFAIECKVPDKGFYKKIVPEYYKDQMQFIMGMKGIVYSLFPVLDLKPGVVRIRREDFSKVRFEHIVSSCKALHKRFVEGLVLRNVGLLHYPEIGVGDIVHRLTINQ